MVDRTKPFSSVMVPLIALCFLCGACFYAGAKLYSVTPNGKYLLAEKNAVILAAVLDRDSADMQALKAEVAQPIVQIMKRYTDLGYVIIEGGKDEHGNFAIAALPSDTRDITQELTVAVAKKGAQR